MSDVRSALVIGSGIGGLTAAVAMSQAGVSVDLVEKQPKLTVLGIGIIQPNNMLRALDRIGLARRCCELGVPFPGWRIFDAHGSHVMDAPNGTDAAPALPPNNGITRPNLHRVLSEAAYEHGTSITFACEADKIEDRGDKVDVTFSDGRQKSYDLVVASDGLYSKTREMLFPDAPKPAYSGLSVWRYNMPRPSDVVWGELHVGPTSKIGIVPIRSDLIYLYVVSAEPGNPRMPEDRLAELMRGRTGGFTGRIRGLVDNVVENEQVVYKPIEGLIVPAPWYKGRTLLIGDAVHATSPHLAQGAAMAIEDAVLLGDLLKGDDPIEAVLAQLMRRRFDRGKYVVETSETIAGWELEAWAGKPNPEARSGELLYEASRVLLEEY